MAAPEISGAILGFLHGVPLVICDSKQFQKHQVKSIIINSIRYGAKVSVGFWNPEATHVICHDSWAVTDAAAALGLGVADLTRDSLAVVSQAWLLACFAAKQVVPTEEYRLKAEADPPPQPVDDDEEGVVTGGGTYWIPQQECQRVTTIAANKNRALTDYLDKVARFYATHQRDNQRELAYMRASAALKAAPRAVTSGEEAMRYLPFISNKTAQRIDEFCRRSRIDEFEREFATERYRVIEMLIKLPWAGPKIVAEWYDQGVRSIDHLGKVVTISNRAQQLCLQHYHDINTPIVRAELDQVMGFIHKTLDHVVPPFQLEVCGGFRRGKPDGKDIDLIITQREVKPAEQLDRLVAELTAAGLLTQEIMRKNAGVAGAFHRHSTPHADLAGDLEQWLGLFQWPLGTGAQRRIDLVFAHYSEYPYAVLAWTGSEMFERSIRQHAKAKGMYLNSRGMCRLETNELVPAKCEEDIFEALGLEYRLPTERHC